MLEILRAIQSEQAKIKDDALIHQGEDRGFQGVTATAFGEIKEGLETVHTEVKALAAGIAKITPIVDELKADKIRAMERADVIRELAEEKAKVDAANEKVAVVKDRTDERRSRWLGPIIGSVIAALAAGWATDHFGRVPTTRTSATVTSAVDHR